MKFLIFLVFIQTLHAFETIDFIENALNLYVNKSADPCENFYRHACPIGSPLDLIKESFAPLKQYLVDSQKNAVWKHVEIKKASLRFDAWANPDLFFSWGENPKQFLMEIAESTCKVSDDLFWTFLDRLQKIGKVKISPTRNVKSADDDKRCVYVLPILKHALDSMITEPVQAHMYDFLKKINFLINKIEAINGHLIVDVREGIASAKSLVDDMKELAKEVIKDTPWALRNNVTERIDEVLSGLNLHDNFAKDLMSSMSDLFEIENSYLSCLAEFSEIEHADLFCYIYGAFTSPKIKPSSAFFLYDNGWNSYPEIAFGYPNYYYNQYGKELSAKLGYTGFTAGHELGHTLVDDHNNLEDLPFFSQNAQNCIQNQYNKTCEYFKEGTCTITDANFDDNGADVIGLQLAYIMLEEYYGDSLSSTIERLGVTHEQLFFYAFAFAFCSGSPQSDLTTDAYHSPSNIRINAAAQHPGFQKAFQCDSNSRIMESATKQCHIYGTNAPQTRKNANL